MNIKQHFFVVISMALSTACITLNADVLILHGSFGHDSRWCRPGGDFYEAVVGASTTQGHTVSPFLWSGGIGAASIIEAAGALVKRILELPPHAQIILLAHSNGGNVCAYATMILAELYRNLEPTDEAPALLKQPFEEIKLTKNRNFVSEIAPHLDTLIDTTFTQLQATIDVKHYLKRTFPEYPIQLVCLMGTPIDVNRFDINMQIVKHAINLFSPADFIQALVGKQLLPEHERRANIQAQIHDTEQEQPQDPCHKNIRNPLIGKWLLDLPAIVASKESATRLTSGTAIFYPHKEPGFNPGVYSASSPASPILCVDSLEEEEVDTDFDELNAESFSIE